LFTLREQSNIVNNIDKYIYCSNILMFTLRERLKVLNTWSGQVGAM